MQKLTKTAFQMPRMQRGMPSPWSRVHDVRDRELIHPCSPLKPAELQVLRLQYEKEGEYVSLQTKFNYAWV